MRRRAKGMPSPKASIGAWARGIAAKIPPPAPWICTATAATPMGTTGRAKSPAPRPVCPQGDISSCLIRRQKGQDFVHSICKNSPSAMPGGVSYVSVASLEELANLEALGRKGGFDLLDVLEVLGFQVSSTAQEVTSPWVLARSKVTPMMLGAGSGYSGQDFGQLGGFIRHLHSDLGHAAGVGESSGQHLGVGVDVHIAAGDHADHFFALDRQFVEEDSSHRGGAAPSATSWISRPGQA